MSMHILAEAALRTLIMGAIIWAALRLLRVHQVRARRAAWLVALAGALLMPALVNWQIGPRVLPQLPAVGLQRSAATRATYDATATPLPATVVPQREAAARPQSAASPGIAIAAGNAAVAAYLTVAALLLIRLCCGVGLAWHLRARAQRITLQFAPRTDVRVSRRIAAPATIASTVLLPASYPSWGEPTLRVVLTHECAHVRQRDFYVHLIASLHCALFWFNPFSWWLKRELAQLGEAMSDRAAVTQAQSRAGYAEILLAFAARAPWPLAAVAMARPSSLTPRIERLLDDRGFEKSFSAKPRQVIAAAGAVLLALIASTSMVRVSAATDALSSPGAPAAPLAPAIPGAPAALAAPVAPTALAAPLAPVAPVDRAAPPAPEVPRALAAGGDEILAIRAGGSRLAFDAGDALPPAAGDYIYYRHDGKIYLLQDPEAIAKARAALAPLQELGRRQQALGRQQAALGSQQSALGAEQLAAQVASPDFKRDMADLERVMRQMDLAHVSQQIDQKALAELQSRLGEIQGRVGVLMAELGMQQAKIGEQQGALGEQQSKLGDEQARLGEEHRRIAEEARRQLQPFIDKALREGAKPLN